MRISDIFLKEIVLLFFSEHTPNNVRTGTKPNERHISPVLYTLDVTGVEGKVGGATHQGTIDGMYIVTERLARPGHRPTHRGQFRHVHYCANICNKRSHDV